MQYRIGDRDPVTGLYDVIWPDGSVTRNGIKIFNSEHQFGDVVEATKRSDGMLILDGAKATNIVAAAPSDVSLRTFGEKPIGYLAGQIFNDEVPPKIVPNLSIAGTDDLPIPPMLPPQTFLDMQINFLIDPEVTVPLRYFVKIDKSLAFPTDYNIIQASFFSEDATGFIFTGFASMIVRFANQHLDIPANRQFTLQLVPDSEYNIVAPSTVSRLIN